MTALDILLLVALAGAVAAVRISWRTAWRWPARIGLTALALIAAVVWLVAPPVPRLPRPTGPYPVGAETFRWVDVARDEEATPEVGDRRNVVAEVFYPAAAGTGPHSIYIDGLGRLPKSVAGFPSVLMTFYGGIDTHARESAPVSIAAARWPVILFSPGYGAPRAYYTGLAAELASRGYVVVTVDHPYEGAVVQLADGRIATPGPDYLQAQGTHAMQAAFMGAQQTVRARDLAFVLDQLGRPGAVGKLAGRVDLARVAAIGHSFGGATAIQLGDEDPRVRASVDIDGMLWGDVGERTLRRPVMVIQSDTTKRPPGDRYVETVRRMLGAAEGPAFRFEIARANHFSFTDATLFFAPAARWGLTWVIGGARGAVETQAITADLVEAFLKATYGEPTAGPEAVARRRSGVGGGRVSPA